MWLSQFNISSLYRQFSGCGGQSTYVTLWYYISGSCNGSKTIIGTDCNNCWSGHTFSIGDCVGVEITNDSGIVYTGKLTIWNLCDGSQTTTGNVQLSPNGGKTTLQLTVPASNPCHVKIESSEGWAIDCYPNVSGGYVPDGYNYAGDCCSGLKRCSDGYCRGCQANNEYCDGTCCSDSRTCCADGKCHKRSETCPCTQNGQNCPESCCNGRGKCADGTCRGCTNNNQTIESCADGTCCDPNAKSCDGRCKTCAPDGEDCGLPCCTSGYGKCADSGNTCVHLGSDGEYVGASGCCKSGLTKCSDYVCRSCTPENGTCGAPCCSGTRCTDNVCRSCIPSGSPDGLCSNGCCDYDCRYDNTCRDCTPDGRKQADCSKSGQSAPCCNYHCRDSDGIDRCRSQSGEGQTFKCDKNGTPVDIPCAGGLHQCRDGTCRGCIPIGQSWLGCPEAPCCNGGYQCANGRCNPPDECCAGFQRCLDGSCQLCTKDLHNCLSNDPCCCSWEWEGVIASDRVGF